MKGQRIGEASHPGPAAGSRATARKRNQQSVQDLFSGDLIEMVKPLLQNLLMDVVKLFLQSGNFGALFASKAKPKRVKKKKREALPSARTRSDSKTQNSNVSDGSLSSSSPPAPASKQSPAPASGILKGKGKGKGKSFEQEVTSKKDEWQVVKRKVPPKADWVLRPSDWDFPILSYDQLPLQLSNWIRLPL